MIISTLKYFGGGINNVKFSCVFQNKKNSLKGLKSNKKFELGYCMSKSLRIPNYCIDGVGIQPDFFINKMTNEMDWDWVNYTRSVLE